MEGKGGVFSQQGTRKEMKGTREQYEISRGNVNDLTREPSYSKKYM